jgi:predicted nucleic acid-binding Zn ribbon protein
MNGLRREVAFSLSDGRPAVVLLHVEALVMLRAQLQVAGELMIQSDGFTAKNCKKCGAAVRPNDRFCDACGNSLPRAKEVDARRRVKAATNAIVTLAVLFVISGVIMFFLQRSTNAEALANLEGMNAADMYPAPIDGQTYTVGQLRSQIAWDAWSILVVNGVLAVVMAGLALWSKRAPLPAIIAAAGTYAVVLVGNAILDPKTIAQGIIVKIVMITLLIKGIRAALEYRAVDA